MSTQDEPVFSGLTFAVHSLGAGSSSLTRPTRSSGITSPECLTRVRFAGTRGASTATSERGRCASSASGARDASSALSTILTSVSSSIESLTGAPSSSPTSSMGPGAAIPRRDCSEARVSRKRSSERAGELDGSSRQATISARSAPSSIGPRRTIPASPRWGMPFASSLVSSGTSSGNAWASPFTVIPWWPARIVSSSSRSSTSTVRSRSAATASPTSESSSSRVRATLRAPASAPRSSRSPLTPSLLARASRRRPRSGTCGSSAVPGSSWPPGRGP